jgi:uncharacterized protein (TIGR02271 family)
MATQGFRELIREGMVVMSADGEKLGKITRLFEDGFEIEKGFVFRTEREARWGDVNDVRGKDVFLGCTREEIERRGAEPKGAVAEAAERIEQKAANVGEKVAEVRIPVVEEEIEAHTEVREAGEVRIHKETVTEERQVTVPVQREVVRVERIPTSGEATAATGAFEEQNITIPVREEQVEIEKRPVVVEEVRVSTDVREGTETAAASVRREKVDVEKTGAVKEREVPVSESEEERLRKAG